MQQFIGVDIGGTSTKFGIVRSDGVISHQASIATCENDDPAHFVARLSEALESFVAQAGGIAKIDAVGVGAPNGNYYTRNIEHAPNLKWKGIVPIARMMEEQLQIKTVVTNDANAAALGEMKFGAACDMRDFVVVTLGTGVGSGFVVNGKMLYGHTGFAGEFGHMIVVRDGRPCGCGRRGCLETYVSATGVVRTLNERLASSSEPGVLRNWDRPFSARAITEAAVEGDLLAREVLRETAQILGEQLANLVTVTSPQAIFLMGGLAQAGDCLFEPTRIYFEENLLNIFQKTVRILPSRLPENNAAILGAAAVAWAEH